MSDRFLRLASRALGTLPTVRPLLRSRFEPSTLGGGPSPWMELDDDEGGAARREVDVTPALAGQSVAVDSSSKAASARPAPPTGPAATVHRTLLEPLVQTKATAAPALGGPYSGPAGSTPEPSARFDADVRVDSEPASWPASNPEWRSPALERVAEPRRAQLVELGGPVGTARADGTPRSPIEPAAAEPRRPDVADRELVDGPRPEQQPVAASLTSLDRKRIAARVAEPDRSSAGFLEQALAGLGVRRPRSVETAPRESRPEPPVVSVASDLPPLPATTAASAGEAAAPVVRIHIGRVDVRAVPEGSRSRRDVAPKAGPTLDDYLRRRRGGE